MIDPQRGEVWRVALDPVRGSEQAKIRPVVIIGGRGIGRTTMRICVPVTYWQPVHAAMVWCVPLSPAPHNGISKLSNADASQVRALDTVRFVDRIGTLEKDDVDTIAAAVALCVGYVPPMHEPTE